MRDPIEREDAIQAITAQEVVDKSIAKRILMQIPSANGCLNCIHADLDDWEFPCSDCRRAYEDYYRIRSLEEGEEK